MTPDRIIKAIEKHNDATKAAAELGISASWMYAILRKNGLRVTKTMKVVKVA